MKKEIQEMISRTLCSIGSHAWVFEREVLGRMKRIDRCDREGCTARRESFTGKPYDHDFRSE